MYMRIFEIKSQNNSLQLHNIISAFYFYVKASGESS